ncbi:related to TIM barrel metal-dependent hydrolase [Rhynchosporium secalis]|uniref:Related to TIM barrel metal-dependent hydrolase n=1 Tax=Rhynchosporium secalis TaxID=38038 RepID=A0A1E1LUW4_RHYSE|nr:related to TIM barrel metal-dependent hydrolase [Rhynchosporium secalis]
MSIQRLSSSSSINQPPEGSWDSHIHVIEPKKYPFPKNIPRIPHEGTMEGALSNASRLSLPNMVFVQVSTYGNDNTWIEDALKEVGPSRGRGVVAFNPETIDVQTLQKWHDLGVRGIRLNLRSVGKTLPKEEIQAVLRKNAEKLRPMKTWSIGLYADMPMLDHVQPLVSELGVKIVLEHFGSPQSLPLDLANAPGWNSLRKMMEDPSVYTKISAPYIFSKDSTFKNLEVLVRSLMSMRNGNGVVFASDWPHTQSKGYDAKPFVEKCLEWCDGDEELQRKLFRDNAKGLWDAN